MSSGKNKKKIFLSVVLILPQITNKASGANFCLLNIDVCIDKDDYKNNTNSSYQNMKNLL